jgi:hypothetical protein
MNLLRFFSLINCEHAYSLRNLKTVKLYNYFISVSIPFWWKFGLFWTHYSLFFVWAEFQSQLAMVSREISLLLENEISSLLESCRVWHFLTSLKCPGGRSIVIPLYFTLLILLLCFFHIFSAFWLWSSVVSVLISVTTDIPPNGGLSRHNNFSLGSCSNGFTLTTLRPSPRIAPRGVWWTRKLFYDTTTIAPHCTSRSVVDPKTILRHDDHRPALHLAECGGPENYSNTN